MRDRRFLPLACALAALAACSGAEPTASPPFPPAPVIPAFAGSGLPAQPGPSQPAPTAAATGDSESRLDADSPLTTPSGATFTGPKGWTVAVRKDVVTLEDPKREVSVTFIESKDASGNDAIAAAWKRAQPAFARKLKLATNPPARGGWDAQVRADYETTTEESRNVWATARRKGDTWYVALFDGTSAGWGRRWPQANIAFSSFKAKGVEEESFRGKKAHALDEPRLRALEAFVEQSREAMKIPGAAVAVVQDGKVVFEKGFGVRELGKKDKVTAETPFMIASITKPLTTLMMASLVDEGKLAWDMPVTRVLPTFALGDPETTKQLTVKHTVCACTGMPRQDMEFIFESAGVTPEMRMESMKTMKPTTGFGETFQYSNLLVAAGGFIGARAFDPKKPLGPAYEEAMQARVFGPLGMKATTVSADPAKRTGYASPHGFTLKLETVATPLVDPVITNGMTPSGGAWSSAKDMAKYVLLELNKGKLPDGKQLVSEKNLMKRREPQVKTNDKDSYGLGLSVVNDRGVPIISHGGNLPGYTSDMFFLPEHGVGAIVLTNLGNANAFRNAVRRKLLEILFDGRDEAREDLTFALKQREEFLRKDTSRIEFDPDRAWLEKLAGTYANASLGKVTVRIEGKQGILDAGEWKSTIGRKKEEDGTVKVVFTSAAIKGIELIPKEASGKMTLTLDVGQQKYVFER